MEETQESNLPNLENVQAVNIIAMEDKTLVEKLKKLQNMKLDVFTLPQQYEIYDEFNLENIEVSEEYMKLGLEKKRQINADFETFLKPVDLCGYYSNIIKEVNISITYLSLSYVSMKKSFLLQHAFVNKLIEYQRGEKINNPQEFKKILENIKSNMEKLEKLIK